ncbi:MAG: hypothetical protein IT319_02515 [Anaerolineae bacterium]|nr:hypothetical protein [Anaerolineae bacterium]
MEKGTDYIREFLAHMGVRADIRTDSSNQKLIVIPADDFNKRRAWIESWFTLIEQQGDDCYFRERPRGTGQTM